MTILDLLDKKRNRQKISMLTCYDFSFARLLDASRVDCLLVGDSAAMAMHGFSSTLPATLAMMQLHTAAVARGAPSKLVVADLPFASYRKDLGSNMEAAATLMQAGAQAVKLEGADAATLALVRHLVDSGIPVMGHLGLTPQSVHQLGGYKVQGREDTAARRIAEQAQQLQEVGSFALVLECVPTVLGKRITQALDIPVIGIGAGPHTDGQVLVLQDMLGITRDFKPKFVRRYWDGAAELTALFDRFHADVVEGRFPDDSESYA